MTRVLRGVSNVCKPNTVTPENSQEPANNQNDTHQFPVDRYAYFNLKIFFIPVYSQESVSLTTGFITLSCFNLTTFLIAVSVKMFEIRNPMGILFTLMVANATVPTIWVVRNKKMKQKAKQLIRF